MFPKYIFSLLCLIPLCLILLCSIPISCYATFRCACFRYAWFQIAHFNVMTDSCSLLCLIPLCLIMLCLIPVLMKPRYAWFRYTRFRCTWFHFCMLCPIPLCQVPPNRLVASTRLQLWLKSYFVVSALHSLNEAWKLSLSECTTKDLKYPRAQRVLVPVDICNDRRLQCLSRPSFILAAPSSGWWGDALSTN